MKDNALESKVEVLVVSAGAGTSQEETNSNKVKLTYKHPDTLKDNTPVA